MSMNGTQVNRPTGLDRRYARAFAAVFMLRRRPECWCVDGYTCSEHRPAGVGPSIARRSL